MHSKNYDSRATPRLAKSEVDTGPSRSSICANFRSGRFAAAVRVGPTSVGRLQHEIDHRIAARITESRGGVR